MLNPPPPLILSPSRFTSRHVLIGHLIHYLYREQVDPLGGSSPMGQVAELCIEGSFQDEEKVRELARLSDVITVEIEHVNTDALEVGLSIYFLLPHMNFSQLRS